MFWPSSALQAEGGYKDKLNWSCLEGGLRNNLMEQEWVVWVLFFILKKNLPPSQLEPSELWRLLSFLFHFRIAGSDSEILELAQLRAQMGRFFEMKSLEGPFKQLGWYEWKYV